MSDLPEWLEVALQELIVSPFNSDQELVHLRDLRALLAQFTLCEKTPAAMVNLKGHESSRLVCGGYGSNWEPMYRESTGVKPCQV